MLSSHNKAYVALHRSPDGQGSGYTIVVANCETVARLAVWNYLCGKPRGYAQCSSSNLLEMEELEDFSLFSDLYFSLPLQEQGIKAEYSLTHSDSEEAPTMVAYMPDEKHHLTFGAGGHEREYVLAVSGHRGEDLIPQLLSKKLQGLLPGFRVINRGTRIEIVGKPYGSRDDDAVCAAVKQVFGENLHSSDL